jgi:hypothetical protein
MTNDESTVSDFKKSAIQTRRGGEENAIKD